MKKWTAIPLALSLLLVLCANNKTRSSPITEASLGNIPDGMYMIVGEASHRCLDIPNSSCGSDIALQIFDCDPADASNNQKFNVVSDGSGNYTISPVHSDLCLEVYDDQVSDRTSVKQNVCSPGKVSQKWAMSQYGSNLEIRAVQNNQCMDVIRKRTANYALVNMHPCGDGTNQRWRLHEKKLNVEKGVICKASPSHPERNCSGVDAQQKQVHLGKTLTKGRCEEACTASKMVSCQWEGPQ